MANIPSSNSGKREIPVKVVSELTLGADESPKKPLSFLSAAVAATAAIWTIGWRRNKSSYPSWLHPRATIRKTRCLKGRGPKSDKNDCRSE